MKAASGVSPEVLALPTGGGAVRSIGDTFSPDLYTGTGTYQVPIWFPRGPGQFQPNLRLIYSSGAGNGPYGMGWRLPLMTIARRSDRGVPRYDDADTFLLDGQELVPLGGGVYRLRIEGEFRRVVRSGDGWEVTDRGGRRFELGKSSGARIEDTVGGSVRTLSWLLERVTDTRGNRIGYSYREDGQQLYVDQIAYGPYAIRFLYEGRPDAVTDRRAGFAITTALRCTGIEYRLPADPSPLLRSYACTYEECPFSRVSLLASFSFSGYDGGVSATLPPLRFGYTPFRPRHRYRAFISEVGQPPSRALDHPGLDLVDMRAEALPGVLEVDGPIRRFWANRGDGTWAPPQGLRTLPSALDLTDPAVALADMDGNGTADVLVLSESPLGYVRNDPGEGWTERERFARAPTFDPGDPNARLVDLDGDGITDLLRTSSKLLYVFLNRGSEGWEPPFAVARQHDLADFPDVSFEDPRVKLADMTGDGLIDVVWVHAGRVDYWPGLGRGRFGRRASLALEPGAGPGFEPRRLFLADINGDGLADVVYVDRDAVRFWINRSGSSLSERGEIRFTPTTTGSNVRVADMFGSGTAGLLWTFPFSRRDPRNYKFLDFTGGVRPYLLQSVDNGIGLVTEIEYEPSTAQARAARLSGSPWATTTPFPVQTVSRITQRDLASGARMTRAISYFDGLFDDREFRGFGRAEVVDEGDAETPSTLTVSHFHQGRRGVTPGETAEDRAALKGRLRRLEVFEVDSAGAWGVPFRVEEDAYDVRKLALGTDGRRVLFPHLTESAVFVHERGAASLVDRTSLVYDDHGNPIEKREVWDSGASTQTLLSHFRYTADTTRWILNLPVELVETDGDGNLLRLRRYFYDGAAFEGLPLGQATVGNLTRREEMVLTDSGVADVYGASPPDFAALGLHRITGPDGTEGWAANTLRQRFDARGNVIRRMDGLGNIGRILFDSDGVFPTSVRDPLGHTFDSDYDLRAQQIVRIADPNGHETRYRFDPLARLVTTIKSGDGVASPTMETDYLETSVPFGVRTRLRSAPAESTLDTVEYFDGFGRRLQLRSSAEAGTVLVDGTRRSNARGWEAFRTVPFAASGFDYVPEDGLDEPRRTSFQYDALGRVLETVTPDGRPSRIVYDLGMITRFDVSDTDASPENVARGHFDTPRVERYDARGRLLRVDEDTGTATLTTEYEFDPKGQLRSIVDPKGVEVASYEYDLLGRKIAVDHVDAGRRLAAYDARGDIALRVDAEGRRVTMRYDPLRRLAETRADGTTTERYTYDAGAGSNLVGRLARVDDEAGEVRFSYTPRGLVEEKIRAVDTLAGRIELAIGYAYDSMERITGITYPDGSVVPYVYDERGLLATISGFVDSFSWNPSGQLAEARLANGVVETYSFDPETFFLAEARVDGPARPEPYYHVLTTHDAVGNPTRIADQVTVADHHRFTREHNFDAAYRLTGTEAELDGVAVTRAYEYDPGGNFRRNGELGADELFLEPGGSNRIAGTVSGGVETTLFAYDANGNLTGSPGRALAFDARGRLSRVTKSDGTIIDLTYGYDGERVRKRVTSGGGSIEVIYVDDLVEIRDGDTTRFVSHQNRRIASVSAAGTHFSHPDHLGNVVLVTDGAGTIVRERGYFPFGTPAFSVGPDVVTNGFIGREFDAETGLVFCKSRYYDPSLGRFISPDPFLLLNPERALGLPASLNLYVYAGNNPVRQVDDTGTWWKWLVGGLIIAALVVATIVVGVATGGAGFAFGILLAASIGSAIGAGVGTYSAWQGGGDLADGFLLGALAGGAAGAAGFAVGAAVAGAGISGVWGSILAGAAEGAVVGAGNGAIVGYAGGKGTLGDVFLAAGIGFLTGAVLGGIAGWVKYNPTGIADKVKDFAATGSASGVDPGSGAPLFESFTTSPGIQSAGQAAGNVLQAIASATAYPVLYAGIGSTAQVLLTYHWDDIKAWILETFGGEEQQVDVPVYSG